MVDDRFLPCCTNRDVLHYTEDSLEFTFTQSLFCSSGSQLFSAQLQIV